MNEEMNMNTEMEVVEVEETGIAVPEEEATGGIGLIGKALIGAAVIGVGALAYKGIKKHGGKIGKKMNDRRIAKLRKQGFEVYSPEELIAMDECEAEPVDEDSEE